MTSQVVTFFADPAVLPGLHVALSSALRSLGAGPPIRFVVFVNGIGEPHERDLRRTFSDARPAGAELEIRAFRSPPLADANPLHGSWTAYGRCYLADLLPDVDRCVYLDCDLLVYASIRELFSYLDGTKTIAADGCGIRGRSLERTLYARARLDGDSACFNSGVLAIDLERWRRLNVTNRCAESMIRFPRLFKTADQALLNVVLHDDFAAFGSRFNTPLFCNTPATDVPQDRIYHFLGAPKPWDLFGARLHRSYELWNSAFRRTAIGDRSPRRYMTLRRAVRISRSTVRVWARSGGRGVVHPSAR